MLQGPKWNAVKEIIGVIQSLTIIAGVVIALVNFRIATQSLTQTKKISSATFLLEISKKIEGSRYAKILSAVDDHTSAYPLLSTRSRKGFTEAHVEDYIGAFETLGNLTHAGIIDPNMVYDELGYDMEKAWCNHDVQKTIRDVRKVDKIESGPSAYYGGFEELAKFSLNKDRKTCSDMDRE